MGNGASEITCCVDRDESETRRDIAPLDVFDGPSNSERNQAFLLVEPSAVTEQVRSLLHSIFANHGIKVLSSGHISTEEVSQRRLIDTHFGVIAAKATLYTYGDGPTGRKLFVTKEALEEFHRRFGLTWDAALAEGKVQNALDASRTLGLSALQFVEVWRQLEMSDEVIRLGPQSQCAQIQGLYVINGFYMKTRARFSDPGRSVYWLNVEFSPQRLSWASFMSGVIGTGPPSAAQSRSVRASLYDDWHGLGMRARPDDDSDACVLASASPFEALVQRMNWLSSEVHGDPFGRLLIAAGVPLDTILAWAEGPTVRLDGERLSVFKCFEGLDSQSCIERALRVIKEDRATPRRW